MGKLFAFPGVVAPAGGVSSGATKDSSQPDAAPSDPKRNLERQLVEMNEVLGKLQPSTSESLRLRSAGLAECSDETLLEALARSHQLRWKQNPAYYRSLARLLTERGLLGKTTGHLVAVLDMIDDGTIEIKG